MFAAPDPIFTAPDIVISVTPVIAPLTLPVPLNDCPQMVLAVVSCAADFTDFAESAVLSTLPRPTSDLV